MLNGVGERRRVFGETVMKGLLIGLYVLGALLVAIPTATASRRPASD
jgi:hypothetical protein